VRVTYAKEKPNVDTELKADDEPDVVPTTFAPTAREQSKRGDAESAFANAPVKLDQTYVTPTETHNPLELHATTAVWEDSKLTLYETTQSIFNTRNVLAQMFGLPQENVRVVSKFLGSGFGSKLWPWTHCPLAVAAARQLAKARQSRREPQNDVPDGWASSPNATARAAERDPGRQARLAPTRLRLPPGNPR
jgi:xanthine dehydrogenase YagR molybdenum-binding subunit